MTGSAQASPAVPVMVRMVDTMSLTRRLPLGRCSPSPRTSVRHSTLARPRRARRRCPRHARSPGCTSRPASGSPRRRCGAHAVLVHSLHTRGSAIRNYGPHGSQAQPVLGAVLCPQLRAEFVRPRAGSKRGLSQAHPVARHGVWISTTSALPQSPQGLALGPTSNALQRRGLTARTVAGRGVAADASPSGRAVRASS
jgi:hypothetical protein